MRPWAQNRWRGQNRLPPFKSKTDGTARTERQLQRESQFAKIVNRTVLLTPVPSQCSHRTCPARHVSDIPNRADSASMLAGCAGPSPSGGDHSSQGKRFGRMTSDNRAGNSPRCRAAFIAPAPSIRAGRTDPPQNSFPSWRRTWRSSRRRSVNRRRSAASCRRNTRPRIGCRLVP
jgi:hypothetical protein